MRRGFGTLAVVPRPRCKGSRKGLAGSLMRASILALSVSLGALWGAWMSGCGPKPEPSERAERANRRAAAVRGNVLSGPRGAQIDQFPWRVRVGPEHGTRQFEDYRCPGGETLSLPEREYVAAVTLDAESRLIAWVDSPAPVHLLVLDAGDPRRCLLRAGAWLEGVLDAGDYLVVVEREVPGGFDLHLHRLTARWSELPLARGVTWRSFRGPLPGLEQAGPQLIHQLVVDLDAPGVELRLVEAGPNQCATVAEIAARWPDARGRLPVAAVNSSFFDPFPCQASSMSASLMRQDGQLLAGNSDRGTPKAALGLTVEGEVLTKVVPAGGDWPQTEWALGARGLLIADGTAVDPERWRSEENVYGHFVGKAHPRTALAVDADAGFAVLTTVDGRRPSARGMTLPELQQLVATPLELDAQPIDAQPIRASAAINLDGGGSTTMWIAGATPSGVVNYPADGNRQGDDPLGREQSEHSGSRAVVGALLVYAEPWNHPPRFGEAPNHPAVVGRPWHAQLDVLDLDLDDRLRFELVEGPAGMRIAPDTGALDFVPTIRLPDRVTVHLRARDDHGAHSDLRFELSIAKPRSQSAARTGGCSTGGRGEPRSDLRFALMAGLAVGLLVVTSRRRCRRFNS